MSSSYAYCESFELSLDFKAWSSKANKTVVLNPDIFGVNEALVESRTMHDIMWLYDNVHCMGFLLYSECLFHPFSVIFEAAPNLLPRSTQCVSSRLVLLLRDWNAL